MLIGELSVVTYYCPGVPEIAQELSTLAGKYISNMVLLSLGLTF